jgi:O-antigen/teichoic acid export membrane protein
MALKRNLIANYLGQGWVAIMSLAFIPFYIKYLGIESYGLIGLFALLQAWLTLLDMGITPMLGREMARFTAGAHSAQSILDLLRSVEVIILSIAALIGFGIWSVSSWLASDWLRAENISIDTLVQVFIIMGVVVTLRFVESIYRSAVVGLQRQVLYNAVNSALATLRWLGAAVILIWVSPTIEAFFVWQGVVSLLTLGTLASMTYRALPKADRPGCFSIPALRSIRYFAGGMLVITFLSLLLTQIDKIILSKLLSLSEFAYYSLAASVAGSLYMVAGPIGQAWFPKLSELQASNQQAQLIEKYHQGAQLMSVLMGSAAIVMIVFAETILQLWLQDNALAQRTATLLSLLALGNLLNGLMWIPYQAQLAYGWTSLTIRINTLAIIIIVPAFFLVIPRYGSEGAAWVWVSLNAGNVLIGIHFMYRKILTEEKWLWYGQDILQPLLSAVTVASVAAWLMPESLTIPAQLVWFLFAGTITLLTSAFAAPRVREALLAQARLRFKFNGL